MLGDRDPVTFPVTRHDQPLETLPLPPPCVFPATDALRQLRVSFKGELQSGFSNA